MNKFSLYSAVSACAFTLVAGASQAFSDPILTEDIVGGTPGTIMQRALDEQIYDALELRRMNYEKIKTPEDIVAHQTTMREFFKTNIGGFPERTPLNAKVVGQGTKENFRYEKIIYESQPGYYVTAILYLPLSEGPYPGILMPCGHSANGKAAEAYQRACISLAMHGFATLCYDPVGQGERYYPYGEDKKALGSTIEHTLLNGGAIPTGANVSMYRIWDGMRGIDYLESRDDILTDKLGVTGNSGGGTLTSYLMALDERVAVAAPSCYLTDYKELTEDSGPHDGEQNTFNQLIVGMNHPDFIHMRAPKPTLMCAATNDFFNINGTWRTYREAKRLYTRLGYGERVDLIETDSTHGFSIQLREGMVRWINAGSWT
jgi:cephalosporin-C deacetylase-like acetyl esterase